VFDQSLAKEITSSIKIPTIGIGSSVNCDGQVLVTDDLLGLNPINLRFLKKLIRLVLLEGLTNFL
jgi:3-methyl-2-oxobutanoate hydroxymethyltransferase